MNKDLVGQVLLNQFRVDAFIESGGMATVYRVWDLTRNVPLAMKVLHADLAEEPAILRRFQREATALKKLTHPHIVPFYGLHQTSDMIFLLERFVDGQSLKDILRNQRGKPLENQETLIYFKALCSSLGYAHANGMIHCDVKPGNVMTDLSGSIYLTDFGIARYTESTTTSLGSAGTAAYMAPEQIRGETVSAATDVYALGVLLFELMTGQRPYRGAESTAERGGETLNERIRYGHLHLPPPDPHLVNPKISNDLAIAILHALSKKQKDRFQSTQEFFEAVCRASGTMPEDIPDRAKQLAPPIPGPQQLVQSVAVPITYPKPVPPHGRRVPFLLVSGVLVLLALGFFMSRISDGMTGPETDEPNMSISSATTTPVPSVTPSPTLRATTTPSIAWTTGKRSIVQRGPNDASIFLSAAVDSNGKYYVAFLNEENDRLMIKVSSANGDWTELKNLGQLNGEGKIRGVFVNLNIGQEDITYLSYQIRLRNKDEYGPLKAAQLLNSGSWKMSALDRGQEIFDMRSALDSSNRLHYAVLTKTGDIRYAMQGEPLSLVEADAVPPASPNLENSYFPLGLAIDSKDRPCVCFSKSGRIQCRYKVTEDWKHIDIPDNGIYPTLQFDANDGLHMAFYDYKTKTLIYAYLADPSSDWKVYDSVDITTNAGYFPSLQVDSKGIVHISYYDESNSALKYASGQSDEWNVSMVDNSSDVGPYSSLILDSQNNPSIGYTAGKLIYFITGEPR